MTFRPKVIGPYVHVFEGICVGVCVRAHTLFGGVVFIRHAPFSFAPRMLFCFAHARARKREKYSGTRGASPVKSWSNRRISAQFHALGRVLFGVGLDPIKKR